MGGLDDDLLDSHDVHPHMEGGGEGVLEQLDAVGTKTRSPEKQQYVMWILISPQHQQASF